MSGRLAPFVVCVLAGCTLSSPYPDTQEEVGDLCDDDRDNDLDGTHDASEVGDDGGAPCAAWHADLSGVTAPARPRGTCPDGWSPSPCTPPSTLDALDAEVALPADPPDTPPVVIHVDAAAGVGGDGSFDAPFSTIGAALALSSAARSTIAIRRGRYVEHVVLPTTYDVDLVGEGAGLVTIAGSISMNGCMWTAAAPTVTGVRVEGNVELGEQCELDLFLVRCIGELHVQRAFLDGTDVEAIGHQVLRATTNARVRLLRSSLVAQAIGSVAGDEVGISLGDSRLEIVESSIRLDAPVPGRLIALGGPFAELVAERSALIAPGRSITLESGARASLSSVWLRTAGETALTVTDGGLELVDVEVTQPGSAGPDAPAIVATRSALSASRVRVTGALGRAIVVEGVGASAVLEDLTISNVLADETGTGVGIAIGEGTDVTARRIRIHGVPSVGIHAGVDDPSQSTTARITLTDVAVLATGDVACTGDCAGGPVGLWLTTFAATEASRFYVEGTAGCGLRIDANAFTSIVQSRARAGALTENRFGLCIPSPYDPEAVALNMPGVLFRDNEDDGLVVGTREDCIEGSARCGTRFHEEVAP